MDDTGDPTKNGQTDVDQEVGIASALQEDTQRRQDEGEDELADVTEKTSQLGVLNMGARMRHWPVAGAAAIAARRHLSGAQEHQRAADEGNLERLTRQ